MCHLGFIFIFLLLLLFLLNPAWKKKSCQENRNEKEDDRSFRFLFPKWIIQGNDMVKLTCALIFLHSLRVRQFFIVFVSVLYLFNCFVFFVFLFSFSFWTTYLLSRNCFHTKTKQRYCHRNALYCSRYPAAIKKNKNNRSRNSHFARLALVTGS